MSGQVGAVHRWLRSPHPNLTHAYEVCDEITRYHSKSFYFATALLPVEKRRSIRALYAFCRWSDDIVDNPDNKLGYSLDGWAAHAHSEPHLIAHDPVLLAWNDTRQRYALNPSVIDDLLAGIRMDLTIHRYDTFEELWLYCYRVAATVGLLSMQIIGYEEGATPYAIKMGVALQLTNILRDVGEDARRGRIYIPLEDVARFGLSEKDVLDGCLDERYVRLIQFQIERTHRLYEESWQGIALLHAEGRYAVAAAATVYREILSALEANYYDNHTTRTFVPTWRKVSLLPHIWWSTFNLQHPN